MLLSPLFRSLIPVHNPMGFGASDFVALGLAIALVVLVFLWPVLARAGVWLAHRRPVAMGALFGAAVLLRVALLPNNPAPAPDVYDEFSHLLVADTLLHGRLANPPHPMHGFFETFFVLQRPTYSSIYPLGQGLMLAFGRLVFGSPWIAVLLVSSLFCAACYWAAEAFVGPEWALVAGVLAVFEFGPLCLWTNDFWGGSLTALAGALVFGGLPRLVRAPRCWKVALVVGAGIALHLLTRPFESLFLVAAVALYFVRGPRPARRVVGVAALPVLAALLVTAVQNRAVTGSWTTLPYQLSQWEYGVPAALSIQPNAAPHAALTSEQLLDYEMQLGFHGPSGDTPARFFGRLLYRIRYYRFYFLPPLYLALPFFLLRMREWRFLWLAMAVVLFALGTNLFPAFQLHYVAGCGCLLLVAAVAGLQRLPAARVVVFLCVIWFGFWYTLHLIAPTPLLAFDSWDTTIHRNPRRDQVNAQLDAVPGRLLVFVRYWPSHHFQDEWVWNAADIDGSRVVFARDRGDAENVRLTRYYPNRKALLLEPDAPTPRISDWKPAPVVGVAPKPVEQTKKPALMFEPIPEAK